MFSFVQVIVMWATESKATGLGEVFKSSFFQFNCPGEDMSEELGFTMFERITTTE